MRMSKPLMPALIGIVALGAAAATPEVPEYVVRFDAATERADVRLCLARAHEHVEFAPDSPRGVRFLHDAHRASPLQLDASGSPWRAKNWRAGECLSYSADIGAIADQHADDGTRFGRTILTDPQHWLLRADVQGDAGASASIELPPDWSVSAPWREVARDDRNTRFHIPDTPSDWSATLAVGHLQEQRIELAGGALRVAFLFEADTMQREKLLEWLRRVGGALLTAYGRMPLVDVQVTLVSIDDTSLPFRFAAFLQPAAVLGGESARGQGNGLQLVIDPSRKPQEFAEDWTAIHELSHLTHPYLGDRGSWLAEGLATYYQNVLRARGGLLSEKQAWERLASGFARGAQSSSRRTLEEAASDMSKSHEFLRVYWAGAAYWLTVDRDLRRASSGALNLESVLSRFRDCCLPAYRQWKPEDFVARLDALADVTTFSSRYREFAAMRQFPDWEAVYRDLGIRDGGEHLAFDGDARDAAIREGIMAPRKGVQGASPENALSPPQGRN